jgi:hypothetical protein
MKELKTHSVQEKSQQITNTNGHNTFAERTGVDCYEIRTSRKEEFRPPTEETSRLMLRPERATGPKSLRA